MAGGFDVLEAPHQVGRLMPMKRSGRGTLRWGVAIKSGNAAWKGYVLYFVPKTRSWCLTPSANLFERMGRLVQEDLFGEPEGIIPAGVKLSADAVLQFLPTRERAKAAREAITKRVR